MRQTATFPLDDLAFWKKQLLHWAAGHELAVYLDSNEHSQAVTSSHRLTTNDWECLAAAGAVSLLETNAGQAFGQLKSLQSSLQSSLQDDKKNDWLFGFFGYDLKNEVERLSSEHFDGIRLPDLGFFQPETVVGIKSNGQKATGKKQFSIEIQTIGRTPEEVFREIKGGACPPLEGGRGEESGAFGRSSPLPPSKGGQPPAGPVMLHPRIPTSEYL
ncbi:MAG TPA: hypothetical protein PK228_16590, partial [Saprospiraceae bacterium]|nr:hypothetical protein [Saprospiraceae bacterium]